MMPLGDVIIAATAILHDLTLLTRNTGDFKHLNTLLLENRYNSFRRDNLSTESITIFLFAGYFENNLFCFSLSCE